MQDPGFLAMRACSAPGGELSRRRTCLIARHQACECHLRGDPRWILHPQLDALDTSPRGSAHLATAQEAPNYTKDGRLLVCDKARRTSVYACNAQTHTCQRTISNAKMQRTCHCRRTKHTCAVQRLHSAGGTEGPLAQSQASKPCVDPFPAYPHVIPSVPQSSPQNLEANVGGNG